MHFSADTIDDLLAQVLARLVRTRQKVTTSRGKTREFVGVLLRLRNPRARLSHTQSKGHVFSCLGELLWYLSGTNAVDFISYYITQYKKESADGKTIYGAYGPRLFCKNGQNQVANVIENLKNGSTTRRAVIQIFDAADIKKRKVEVPCTCTLQFILRRRRLHLVTYMRSNDAFKGLPHDVFAFTMLQEIIARSLDAELGEYRHAVGSLHIYDDDLPKVELYLQEGWQTTQRPMPDMPPGDPWEAISHLLRTEKAFRLGQKKMDSVLSHEGYWADLARLLRIFRHWKDKEYKAVTRLKKKMTSRLYNPYIQRREEKPSTPRVETQLAMAFMADENEKRDVPAPATRRG